MEKERKRFWALAPDGDLHDLGEHDCYDDADEQADIVCNGAVWLVDEQQAEQWRKALKVDDE